MASIHKFNNWILIHPCDNFMICGSVAHKFYFYFSSAIGDAEKLRKQFVSLRSSGRFGAVFQYGNEWPTISGFECLEDLEDAIEALKNTDYAAAYASCPWFPFEFEV
jgi:hypothetical protein